VSRNSARKGHEEGDFGRGTRRVTVGEGAADRTSLRKESARESRAETLLDGKGGKRGNHPWSAATQAVGTQWSAGLDLGEGKKTGGPFLCSPKERGPIPSFQRGERECQRLIGRKKEWVQVDGVFPEGKKSREIRLSRSVKKEKDP